MLGDFLIFLGDYVIDNIYCIALNFRPLKQFFVWLSSMLIGKLLRCILRKIQEHQPKGLIGSMILVQFRFRIKNTRMRVY